MANNKKTYTEKLETKSTEDTIVSSVDEVTEDATSTEEKKPAKAGRKKKVFDNTDLIDCKSMVHGGLYMKGRATGQIYSWIDMGDIAPVEYRDLVAEVRNTNSKFAFGPRFYVLNDEFVEQFPKLKEFYDNLYTDIDFMNILNMPIGDMTRAIEELPKNAKERLKTYVGFQMGNGMLDSISKIKALDEIFGTNLSFVSSMNG